MAKQVQFRRGNTSANDAFTGAQGEITVNTDDYSLRVHDGETQGGFVTGSSAVASPSVNGFYSGTPAQNEIVFAARVPGAIDLTPANVVIDALTYPSAEITFEIKDVDGVLIATYTMTDDTFDLTLANGPFTIEMYQLFTITLVSAPFGVSNILFTIFQAEVLPPPPENI